MKKQSILAAALALLGSSAFAESYQCDFSKGGNRGWIAPVVLVELDADKGTASVMDGITRSKQDGWFPAKISADTKKRYTVSWTVRRLKSSTGQNVNGDFRLTVQKASLDGTISMLPHGYSNKFTNKGKCKLR